MPKGYQITRTLTVLFLLLFSHTALATFYKNLWPIWLEHNPLSTQTIQHDEWQAFLSHSIITDSEGINLVDYGHLKKTDTLLLKDYIDRMSKIPIGEYNRNEQLAFWLNLYNAVTVYTISQYYPISSIEEINISPGLFSIGPWGAKLVSVNNIALSLDEIENRIIRPVWNDPRCHYAINNGSIGSPNLAKQAYLGQLIEQQLNKSAINYVNSLRGVQIIDNELVVSKIYEWFGEDFGENKQNIINHLLVFAQQPLKSKLKHINHINNYFYNWHLNSTITLAS